MATANIKLSSEKIELLKKYTEENTGQKAVLKAVLYFLRDARQRNIINVLKEIKFDSDYDPVKARENER